MAIKIKEMSGYQISYDPGRQHFIVEDKDGTELAFASTQERIEVKVKSLSKQEFKRVPIVRVRTDGSTIKGELTSLNRDDNSAWVSMGKGVDVWGSGREKLSLSYTKDYYELTETNTLILKSIETKSEELIKVKNEMSVLVSTLEKPINLAYFGITRV